MSDELDIDDDVDDLDDDRFDSISLKYCFEGAASLPDLATALRAVANDFDRVATEGWQLLEPVDGSWAHLEHP